MNQVEEIGIPDTAVVHASLLLPATLLERIDDAAVAMRNNALWAAAAGNTRSTVVRAAIALGTPEIAAKFPSGLRPPGRSKSVNQSYWLRRADVDTLRRLLDGWTMVDRPLEGPNNETRAKIMAGLAAGAAPAQIARDIGRSRQRVSQLMEQMGTERKPDLAVLLRAALEAGLKILARKAH